jgi:hypothetical protein
LRNGAAAAGRAHAHDDYEGRKRLVCTTGLRMNDGFSISERSKNLFPSEPSQPMSTRRFDYGVKRPERETNHLPATSSEAKIWWNYNLIPPHVFMI